MPFNFGSLFGAVGHALPGFIEGERAAVQDNWRDLNQYNQVQAGQLENAWTEATWDPRLFNTWANAASNDIVLQASGMELANRLAAQPGQQTRNWLFSDYADDFYPAYYNGLGTAVGRAAQMGMALPDPGANINTPSLGR